MGPVTRSASRPAGVLLNDSTAILWPSILLLRRRQSSLEVASGLREETLLLRIAPGSNHARANWSQLFRGDEVGKRREL